jgi:hypothetical protein
VQEPSRQTMTAFASRSPGTCAAAAVAMLFSVCGWGISSYSAACSSR